ncbi:hypothetical protein AALB_0657 [Agarivorans albus MKT 106]|uniref:Uncharacterized protein n=1 Tax=Agarivorans albus MKT 106 TaxID=1331007 RepID=R9PGV6_AGAAL|nr:hypothetical protein AALB_0657 [Agarivorans albus MKT 106]
MAKGYLAFTVDSSILAYCLQQLIGLTKIAGKALNKLVTLDRLQMVQALVL